MSTRIPDTIPAVVEGKMTGSASPVDIGGIMFKPSDYPFINKIDAYAALVQMGGGSCRVTFCDFYDNFNILGMLETDSEALIVKEEELSTPIVSEDGWSCINVRLQAIEGGTAICAIGGVRIC